VHSCYEAGPFGYGLHRALVALGIENIVVQPVCLDERHTGVNHDKSDARELAQRLDRYVAGNRHALATVRVPTSEEEQKRAASRQREQLKREVQRVAAQGRSLLLTQGFREKKGWWGKKRWEQLSRSLVPWLAEQLEVFRRVIATLTTELQALTGALEKAAPAVRPKGLGGLSPQSATATSSKLHSWWAGDGNAFDLSDHKHLVLRNGGFAPGLVGQAFSFDGTSGYAIYTDGPVLTQTDDWSFEAWVFWKGLGDSSTKRSQFLFYNGQSNPNTANGFGLSILEAGACELDPKLCGKEGELSVLIGGVERHPTGVRLPVNTWTHVALTRANGELELLVNGEKRFSAISSSPRTPLAQFTLSSQNESFNGLIDEAAIYDYALSQSEVKEIVATSHKGKPKGELHRSFPLPDKAVLWWTGDQTTEDLLGHRAGFFQGRTAYQTAKVSDAFDFDGTDSFLIRTNDVATTQVDNWSLSFWIYWRGRIENPGKETSEIFYNGHSGRSGFGIRIPEEHLCAAEPSLCPHRGTLVVIFGGIRYYPTGVSLDVATWNHIVLSRSEGILKLFKNGQPMYEEASVPPNVPDAANGWITVGGTAGDGHLSASYSINAVVDEVLLFEKALSEHEIIGMYVAGTSGLTKAPSFTRIVRDDSDNLWLHYQSLTGRTLMLETTKDFTWKTLTTLSELKGQGRITQKESSDRAFFRLQQQGNK
jgi:hypothetical protein